MALTQAQIQAAFQNSLGRPASATELSSFFAVSQSGAVNDAGVINAISNSTEADRIADPVVRFYEAAFGRVPDQAGLNNAEAYIRAFIPTAQTYQNLAVQFTQSQEFQNRFGSGTTVDAAYVTALYTTILGRTPSSGEVDGFVSGSNGYTTRAQVLYAISQSNEAQGISNNAVNGFLANVASGTAVFTGDLYTSANGAPNGAVSGSAFTLTTATDNLTGTAGADTFIGNNTTLTTADLINGGAGNDTLRLIETAGTIVVPVLTSVERIEVQNFGTGSTENINLTNSSGYNTIAAVNGSGNNVFTGITAVTAAEASNTTNGGMAITYNAAAVAGTADVQTLALNSGTIGGAAFASNGVTYNGGLTVNGIETLAITANNINPTVGSAVSGVTDLNADGTIALKTITVGGAGQLTIGGAGALQGALVNGVNTLTLDASANTGGVTATFGAGTDTVTGGSGADKFIFGVNFDSKDVVNGGAGTDTISIAGADFTAVGAANNGQITNLNTNVSNIEVLELTTNGVATVLDQSALTNAAITKILFNTTGADTVTNATTAETYALGTLNNGAETFTLAQGQQTLNLNLEGSSTANVTAAGVTVNNGNTVNIVSTGSFAGDHNIGGLTTGNNETVNISGNHDLNVGTLAVATPTAIGGAAALGDTVNAGSLTGKLTVTGSQANDSITVGSGGSVVTGSIGADSYTLGTGKDQINYTDGAGVNLATTAGFSTTQDLDTATNFTAGTDKFIVATTVTGVNSNSVTGTGTLLADLQSAANPFANNNNATVVTVNGGTDAGTYLVVNANTAAAGVDNADLVVKLVGLSGTLTATDFKTVIQ